MGLTRRSATVSVLLAMTEDRKRAGQRLVALREARGWTQPDLAYRAGLSAKTISRFENGHHDGRRDTIRKLLKALGIEEADLMGPPRRPLVTNHDDGFEWGIVQDQLARIETMLRWLMLQAGARPEDLEALLTEPASSGAVPELPEALLPEGARASNGEKAQPRPRSQTQERHRKSS